jgi:predicted PolB exonuclease-like 3'-5' exonuclease
MPEPEVATGNLKDEAKIKAKIEAAKADQVAKMGLDPWTSLICAFAFYDHAGASGFAILEDESADGEAALLHQIWGVLERYNQFVTFNGNEFDVPVLRAHSLLRRVRPSVNISTKKYQISNHFDVRAVLTGWDKYARGTMDWFLQRILGRSKPEDISGALVQDYWDCGATNQIADYCQGDAKDTWDLYQVVSEYYDIQ